VAVFTRTGLPGERQVYRTSGSLVAWWAWVAFAVVLLIALALGHHSHAALVTASVVIAITGIMYACALRPRIVADAAGITVENPLRVHEVPWPAVTQVDLVHNVRVHYRSPAGSSPAGSSPAGSSPGGGLPGGGLPGGGLPGGGLPGGGLPGGGLPGGEKVVHSWAVQSTGRSKTRHELRARRAARRGMTREPGYARLPDAAQAALAGSAAEFIARQLDEQARVQRSASAAEPAATEPAGAGPAAGGHAAASDAGSGSTPKAVPAVAQVRWSWGPIAVMVVPLLLLLALTLA
jgi:Bacterial PH domain